APSPDRPQASGRGRDEGEAGRPKRTDSCFCSPPRAARMGAPPDGSGALMYQYVYASSAHSPDFVVDATGAVYRVVTDQLGSPLLIVNVADVNDVLLEAEYSAFGERTVLSGDGDALTLGFAGGVFDADTGLTRFGARDYDPTVGRWTAKDPILWGGHQSNLYVYAHSDAMNYADPSGQGAVAICLVPWAWSAALAGAASAMAAGAAALTAAAITVDALLNWYAKKSGKEKANDAPSWAKGERPLPDESGNEFADRLLDEKYGPGNYPKRPGTEHNRIKKWGDRGLR